MMLRFVRATRHYVTVPLGAAMIRSYIRQRGYPTTQLGRNRARYWLSRHSLAYQLLGTVDYWLHNYVRKQDALAKGATDNTTAADRVSSPPVP